MAPLQTVLLLFGLQSGFMHIMSLIMQPIYWAVSGIIVGFHKLWAPVTGQDSGLTWVLTTVSLVVLIRTLLIPIFVKQINASRNMQLIQPKVKALQDKYGSDRERLGQETMKLYKEEGVNPAASCLPALLQMPIFMALFRVLQGAASDPIVARGHFFKINPDLVQSLHDATFLGAQLAGRFLPLNQGFGATQIMATVLIILMSLVLFIQQRELMQLFQKYKGDDCVYLQLMGSRKLIKTTPNFWVNSEAPGFAEDVVKILGENCVVKKD